MDTNYVEMSSRPRCLFLNFTFFPFISQSYCKMLPLGMFMGQPSYKSNLCARVFSKIQSSQACTIAVRIFSSFSLRLKVQLLLSGLDPDQYWISIRMKHCSWLCIFRSILSCPRHLCFSTYICKKKQIRSFLDNKINNPTALGKDQPDSWHAGCTELSHILPLSLHSWF